VPDPHHRIIAAKKAIQAGEEPEDAKVRDIILVFTKHKDAKPELTYAIDVFLEPYQRTVMDALLLGRGSIEDIHEGTEIPHNVIAAYSDYLFDQTVFRNNLDRITWVQDNEKYLDQRQLQLLQSALTVGAQYLIWMITGRGKFSPAEVLRHTMNDAMFRGMAHRNAPLDSPVAKEALQWIRIAHNLAKSLHQIDPEDAKEAEKQLRMALTYEDTTVNAQTSGLSPEDILH
jgi:hypothetical protein